MSAPRPRLIVLASTYPRWRDDPEPGFVHELSRRLVQHFDVTVLTPHAPGAAACEEMDGVRVERFRYAPSGLETLVHGGGMASNVRAKPWKWLLVPPFLLAYAVATAQRIRRMRPDVLHVHWLIPQGLVALAGRRLAGIAVPFVVTSHGADLFSLRGRMARWLKRKVARACAAMTVVSDAMRQEATRQGLEPSRISVAPMGADLAHRFTPGALDAQEPDTLLFVGRLVEKKGVLELLAAMPRIVAARPSARLRLAGFGPLEASCRQRVEALALQSNVEFLGAVSNAALPDLYRRSPVVVAPFRRATSGDEEGLGLVAVEAAGCGCRLVLGDVAAARSAFDGLDGVELVDGEDAAGLAEACLRALAAGPPPASLRAHMVTHYDWGARAAAYARLLLERARAPD